MPADVLIVSARPEQSTALSSRLKERGYSVAVSTAALASWPEAAREAAASIVILDAPHVAEIRDEDLKKIRRDDAFAPCVVILGEGDIAARVRALNAGADACLPADASTAEVVARVHALLRRAPIGARPATFSEGDLTVDLLHRVATFQGQRLHLSPYEYRVLRDLALQVMETRSRFAGGPEGDDRLAIAVQELHSYAKRLEQRRHEGTRGRRPRPERQARSRLE